MKRLGALLGVVIAVLAPAGFASAAGTAGDQVDSFQAVHRVTADGALQVTETIVYRFGSGSGRHGILRDLLVREPYVDDLSKDQLYQVTDVQVSSPSGANAEVTEEPLDLDQGLGRQVGLRLRIGSQYETISGATATYVIKYRVKGALRHFKDHTEVFWDATGRGWTAPLRKVAVTVEVPGGVTRVACFAGAPKSKKACAGKSIKAAKGVFSQASLAPGHQLTYVAAIRPGLVRNDTPLLEPATPSGEPTDYPTEIPTELPPGELPPDFNPEDYGTDDPFGFGNPFGGGEPMKEGASAGVLVMAGAAGLLLPVGVAAKVRSSRRDHRYAGLPPGMAPVGGAVGPIGPDTLRDEQIPVAYAPPAVAVAEAGLLIDGQLTTTETAATLIDLAVRGAVRIEAGGSGSSTTVTLLDPALATYEHETALLKTLFIPFEAGQVRTLTSGSSMASAHFRLVVGVERQAEARGWYERMPVAGGGGFGLSIGLGVVGLIAAFIVGSGTRRFLDGVLVVAAFLIGGISLNVLQNARAKGRRSAAGRAVTDQALGFRKYLATAEADQLRFEEGEDIFSRYLPWAIVFGLTGRWQQVCAQLVAAGRIPAGADWYSGPSYFESSFTTVLLAQQVSGSFTAPMSDSSFFSGSNHSSGGFGGSSFGSGSSFGGGGGSSSGFSSSSDSGAGGGSAGGGGGGGGSW
ncbi:DUF2207 domain-containing protein [Kribbella deserti]|uniref:DUF2207 domain-containing protein n=1 Tax=Kribbella deserti TaxID=1926257 RepID=A0ABV6QLR5_9ACTN